MQFNLLSETVASALTVTVALTHALSLSPSLGPLCVLIRTRHCKKGTINASSPFSLPIPPLHLKVMAFPRMCSMQKYKEWGSGGSRRDISVHPPPTKFSWGSSLQHHHYSRSSLTQGHTVQMTDLWTHFYEKPIFPLMAKVDLSLHYVLIRWSHFITF